jgi:tetratricopeptide (TPR) repeat protein
MTPGERQELEHKAERSLRRGELREALALFRQLAQAFPGDAQLASRLAQVEGNLQSGELTSGKNVFRAEAPGTFTSPTHEAEALASRGDFAGAVSIYRKVLAANPAAELVKERLTELFQLAQARTGPRAVNKEQLLQHLLERVLARKGRKFR